MRTSQGVGADATGGDFRFQGQWLESATGIYNFRARDYDSRTGTFLSRDPVDPISTEPESFNPYQFEYNNPFVYSDPTGMFTILEVNATQAVQNGLQNARTYALRELKEKAVESAQDFAADFAVSALRSILPIDIPGYLKNFSNIPVRQGNLFEAVARGALCQILTSIGADDWMWNEAKIKPDGRGTPVRPGYRCSDLGDIAAMRRGMYGGSRGNFPDFLFKQEEPTDTSSRGYLIGDFKRSTETVYREIKDPNNTQWKAIKGYAKNQQYIPVVAFVTYIHDKKKVKVSQLRKEFIEQGLIATVESFVNGKGNFF